MSLPFGEYMETIKIVIDNEKLNKYREHYFKKYPKRKKFPIERVFPPSLNRFITMKRMMQNNVKQNWKEFSVWLANEYEIANLGIDKATITYSFYFNDHRRRDQDNTILTVKFVNDGLVIAGVLTDDDGEKIQIIFDRFHYDKVNPRIEMVIEYELL